ncbi:RNI-like protein [Calocera viscosa TUFC12733]|uniref:RNI-like protein n=1 Tax=Calocera viscosa (strain TUFC12733) TaxID=1330018 RepID=A0A167K3N1_CALVF|nr:RNI-like protein [Calocera viscosa TUFC12733]
MASVTAETTHLMLNHNQLGDGGTRMLFHLLRTQCEARIEEINLNDCDIGDDGLRWIAEYLQGNTSLERLYLNGNRFQGDETAVTQFVDALNHSVLRLLSLSTNNALSDRFLTSFLPSLRAPHLRSLHMSMLGLTALSVPLLTNFLSSKAAKYLDVLTLNANSLGYAGVCSLISCVEQHPSALQTLELDANSVEGEEESPDGAKKWLKRLREALLRNALLKASARSAAMRTLHYARTVLNARAPSAPTTPPPFLELPTELHLLILRQVGDPQQHLSDAQFTRVVEFATGWEYDGPGGPVGRVRWLERVGCMYYERETE